METKESFTVDKKLSREQKIVILLRARDMIKNREEICMCPAISESFNKGHIVLVPGGGEFKPWNYAKSLEVFPRLLDFKPKKCKPGETWFAYDWFGRRKRVKILDKIIKELKKR